MKILFLISGLLLGTSVLAQNNTAEDKTIFVIDDLPVKQSTLALYHSSKDLKPNANAQQQQARQLQSAQELINIYLLSSEAEKNGLDDSYNVKQALDLARRTVLMKAMVEKYTAEIQVSEKELEAAYTLVQENALAKADFIIRNIIVDKQETAIEIIDKLKRGESFSELERTHSPEGFIDSAASEWMNRSMVQPEIATAIAPLKKTEFTLAPVKTQFGWHVILVEDKKMVRVPPLDKIKNDLTGLVKKKKLADLVRELRAKVSVTTPDKTQ